MARQLVPLLEVPEHRAWCSERFARRLVAERRIAFHKVGGALRYRREDLDAFAQRVPADATSYGKTG